MQSQLTELSNDHSKRMEQQAAEHDFGVSPLATYSLPNPLPRGYIAPTVPGIPRKVFNAIVEASCIEYAINGGLTPHMDPRQLQRYTGTAITQEVIRKVVASPMYHNTLVLRGVRSDDSTGLSGDQMRALQVLTDTSKSRSLENRLKLAGISWYEWQAWMRDPLFKAHHDRLAQRAFQAAQESVDLQVASGALDGKLDFIKYYNELTGRHDPARKASGDVKMILQDIVDIITRNVKDEATLNKIAAELRVSVAKLGDLG